MQPNFMTIPQSLYYAVAEGFASIPIHSKLFPAYV